MWGKHQFIFFVGKTFKILKILLPLFYISVIIVWSVGVIILKQAFIFNLNCWTFFSSQSLSFKFYICFKQLYIKYVSAFLLHYNCSA